MVLIKVYKSLFHMASFFGILLASPASCDAFTIVKHFFFLAILSALILKATSLSLMDLKQFFMWNHLVMPFMSLLMGNLQVMKNYQVMRM